MIGRFEGTTSRCVTPFALSLALVLVACSGGGSGDTAPIGDGTPGALGGPPGGAEDGTPSAAGDGPAGGVPGNDTPDAEVPRDDGPNDGAPGRVPDEPDGEGRVVDCSVAAINGWVDERMRDQYLYAERVPLVDPSAYDAPEPLVEDLRVPPDIFSYIGDRESDERRIEEGYRFGFGYRLDLDEAERVRFRQVRAGSPAEEAGIHRGEELLTINGVPIAEVSDAQFDAFFGGPDESVTQTLLVRGADGTSRELRLTKAEYYYYTADLARRIERDGLRIGYLSLSAFYETTARELDEQIAWLDRQDIDELVLDMRYNPGGRASVARRFAAQLVGNAYAGEPFQVRRFNERYASENYTGFLETVPLALDLPRVVVLTSERTASAAESVISGLEPYIDVTVVGERTVGKPFTSRSVDRCDRRLHPVVAIRTNAAGVSVAGGIEPDCAIADDYLHPQHDERDALTKAGIDFIVDGRCPIAVAAKAPAQRPERARTRTGTGMGAARGAVLAAYGADAPADIVE